MVYFVLLRPLTGFLIVADTPKHSEAIVVLGGGLAAPRVVRAVKLYEKGLAPIIILIGQEMEFNGRERYDLRILSWQNHYLLASWQNCMVYQKEIFFLKNDHIALTETQNM